jgi:hypothetical protein
LSLGLGIEGGEQFRSVLVVAAGRRARALFAGGLVTLVKALIRREAAESLPHQERSVFASELNRFRSDVVFIPQGDRHNSTRFEPYRNLDFASPSINDSRTDLFAKPITITRSTPLKAAVCQIDNRMRVGGQARSIEPKLHVVVYEFNRG